jgi:hypothetical protein
MSEIHILHEILKEEELQTALMKFQIGLLEEIRNALRPKEGPATKLVQTQIGGTSMARNKFGVVIPGTVKGTTSRITVSAEQADGTPGALQAGNIPAWSVDDTAAVLAPAPDGSFVDVSIPLGDAAASYNLTVSAVSANGSPLSQVNNYPILPAPEGPATQLVQTQIS